MNIVQIRYTKYHFSGDKAQINIYTYIFTMCMILQKEKQKIISKKRHCTNNNKKYINKEREKETRGRKIGIKIGLK
jgi:hypothetical protein